MANKAQKAEFVRRLPSLSLSRAVAKKEEKSEREDTPTRLTKCDDTTYLKSLHQEEGFEVS
jgi:hypothetical protein